LDKGNQRFLPNEPVALLNLYETIARPGTGHPRVVLFMLANALTITNPYFLYWDLKMPTKKDKNNKWIWKHPTRPILVEDVRNEKFIDTKKNTEFGKLIEGTTYSGYSIDNKFLLDNDTFVEKRSPKAKFYFTFIYLEHTLGVWIDATEGKMYVSKDIDPSYPLVYSITLKDHKPNTMLIKNKSRNGHFKIFLENYQLGNVYFESINIKNITYEVIKMSMN
ncbi:MAG: phage DNA encapsidation protein, partial [Romboutsia sp.]|nr:phage DNA encapsidation protein [Romboutsia sp.]